MTCQALIVPRDVSGRIRILQRQIAGLGPIPIFTGTLSKRTKLCGKPTCACATDPAARHGPYFEWSRIEGGRLTCTSIDPETAAILACGIEVRRKIEALIAQWKKLSLATLQTSSRPTTATQTNVAKQRKPRKNARLSVSSTQDNASRMS